MHEEITRLGIFGGTFNPIHYGHLNLAEAVCAQMGLERIIFIPDSLPPHKLAELQFNFASGEARYEMVRRAIEGKPQFSVSDLELRRKGLSYTVDTLRELGDMFPNTSLYFIVGADSIKNLHTWNNAHQLLQLANFVGIGRPGYDDVLLEAERHFGKIARERIVLLDAPQYDISATAIRQKIHRGEDISMYLPPAVEEYIREQQLYK